MHVLIIKLTSMGDLIHTLPAVTDAVRAVPGIQFDWVADEAFVDIPRLHPAIGRVIPTAHRRWRRAKWQAVTSNELCSVWRQLRQTRYDQVIDAQGSIKSAVITGLTRGWRCGLDKASARERWVQMAYNQTFTVPVAQPAVTRQRQLFAQVLGYPLPTTPPDFAVSRDKLPTLALDLPRPYLVFVQHTTWPTKHWPLRYWQHLLQLAVAAGYHVVLPWGNAHEQACAQQLAATAPGTTVLPPLSIQQQAAVLAQAVGAVCVDTGLGHLAAALNTPAVHLYGPTDPALIGATGQQQLHLVAEYACAPCYLRHCKWGSESACFVAHMRPEYVWQRLQTLL